MKPTKLMLGAMILGLGMTAAAWAQPAPSHDRDDAVRGYTTDRGDANRGRGDRDDVYRGEYNPYWYQRGDRDHDRDDRGAWSARGQDNDRNGWRGDRDAHNSWNWGHSDVRRGKRDDR